MRNHVIDFDQSRGGFWTVNEDCILNRNKAPEYSAWPSFRNNCYISIISIYQSNQYPFSRGMIGSCNSRYPRLSVDFEAEVKRQQARVLKLEKKFTLYCFFENKEVFLVNTKTTIPLGVGAQRQIYIHLPSGGQLLNIEYLTYRLYSRRS